MCVRPTVSSCLLVVYSAGTDLKLSRSSGLIVRIVYVCTCVGVNIHMKSPSALFPAGLGAVSGCCSASPYLNEWTQGGRITQALAGTETSLPVNFQHFQNPSNVRAVAMSVWRISNTCCRQTIGWQQDPWVSAFLIPISLQQHSQSMNPRGMSEGRFTSSCLGECVTAAAAAACHESL